MGIAAVVFKGGAAKYLFLYQYETRNVTTRTRLKRSLCKVKKEMVLPQTMQQHHSDYRVRQTLNPLASARIAMLKVGSTCFL
jgi:hypothetical protein